MTTLTRPRPNNASPALPAVSEAGKPILTDLRKLADNAAATVKSLADELYGAERRLPAGDRHLVGTAAEDVATMAALLARLADQLRAVTQQ